MPCFVNNNKIGEAMSLKPRYLRAGESFAKTIKVSQAYQCCMFSYRGHPIQISIKVNSTSFSTSKRYHHYFYLVSRLPLVFLRRKKHIFNDQANRKGVSPPLPRLTVSICEKFYPIFPL